MQIDFAPLEGITGNAFRAAHHRIFGGVSRYFLPFVSPTQNHCFTPKESKNIAPEGNAGVPVVPQVLTRNAEDFIWAAGELRDRGYEEVNLNLGCPSGTVAGKGKGAGFLRDLQGLEGFLEEIFARSPLPVSIKTRIGIAQEDEWEELSQLYARFPVKELIVHPRLLKDVYRHPARKEVYVRTAGRFPFPVSYNGDLCNVQDCADLQALVPETRALMIGRGLVADPALARRVQGGAAASREELTAFHETVYEALCTAFGSRRNAMLRMKEVWLYHICLFEGADKLGKSILKTHQTEEFERLVRQVLETCPMVADVTGPMQASMK